MSDQQTASPVNLFKTRVSSSNSGQNLSHEITPGKSVDKTFSRELSKANEQNVKRDSESSSERSTERLESPRQSAKTSNNESKAHNGKNTTRRSDGAGQADQGSIRDSRQTSEKESVAESKASTTELETSEQQTKETKTDTPVKQVTSNTEQIKQQTLQAAENENAQLNVQQNSEELVAPNDENPLVPKVSLAIERLMSTEQSVDTEIETDVDEGDVTEITKRLAAVEHPSEAIVTTGASVTSIGLAQSIDVDGQKISLKPLTVGEQLSPAQLAKRQTHLFNNVASGPLATSVTGPQPTPVTVVDLDAAHEASRSTTVAVLAAASQTGAMKEKNINSVVDRAGVAVDGSAKATLLQTTEVDTFTEHVLAKNRLADDAIAAANLTEKLASQKIEQQTIQNNLLQTRQMSQQQAQNLNLLTATSTVEPSDRASQSSDNMFLSLPGGIVTAPVVQRPDAGNNQTINAPLNMPILQNDAEKAMAGNIRWMVNEGVKSAVVNVTPSGMGPISVSIGIEKDQMNISIVALQGSTREALDSMIPRLREQFAAQGQDNVRVDISDGRAEQSDRGYEQQFSGDQSGSEQENSGRANRSDVGEMSENPSTGYEMQDSRIQGLITINENGQIRSRYDAYV